MRLPRFELVQPLTLTEAVNLMDSHWPHAQVMAGGTALLVAMKQRIHLPKLVVSLERITEDRDIAFEAGGGLRLGALTTLREISRSVVVREHYPALAEAAASIASPLIRNRATLGGNLCLEKRCWFLNQSATWREARPPCLRAGGDACLVMPGAEKCHALITADTATALIALEAEVVVLGPAGRRRLRLEDFYAGLGNSSSVLNRAELIAQVRVPPPAAGATSVYLRHATRMTMDYPLVQVGTLLEYEQDVCRKARIVVGAVAPTPMRAMRAEAVITGERPSPQVAAQAAAEAVRDVRPVPYIFRTPGYKRRLTRAYVEDAILLASGMTPADALGTHSHGGEL